MPLQYSMSFLAKTIVGIEALWPDTRLEMSSDLKDAMDGWLLLAERGVMDIDQEVSTLS
ncbi:hypothetical protein [Burkholderia sp. BCC1999]|uniref:hypothetical protein n=1 Tax=Burkholderia sp. BCC1999 TaxID=2817448 RepID=UPI002AC34776|nr:hypothetical protein [Burkholderia sp. BCC1999]